MNQVKNQVTLIGYLGDDPKSFGKDDRRGASFDLATNEKFGPDEHQERTDWHRIVCWNGLANSCSPLAKGDQVAIFGKLRTNTWKDEAVPAHDAVLSVATHRWENGRRVTTWYRVVVWDVYRTEHIGVRIARKGTKVEITGRKTSFTTRDGHLMEQVELIDLRILRMPTAPEIP